jgi:hypothetical protein
MHRAGNVKPIAVRAAQFRWALGVYDRLMTERAQLVAAHEMSGGSAVTDEPMVADTNAGKFAIWRVAKGEHVDTDVTPRWRRTGYGYFPYAACESGHAWVLRVNHCFRCSSTGGRLADVTRGREDTRPLLASIGALNPILPDSLPEVPLMAADLAKAIVDAVANYVAHGAEWGDPCDWCVFDERDPYSPSP